jgi:hypothetical protein
MIIPLVSENYYILELLIITEVGQTTDLMGCRAARAGGCGVPVPRALPWGR